MNAFPIRKVLFSTALCVALGSIVAAPLAATAQDSGEREWAPEDLVQDLGEIFKLFVSDADDTLLMPRESDVPYNTIELRDGQVYVDGLLWSDSALERAIGADAEVLLEHLGRSVRKIDVRVEVDEWDDDTGADDEDDQVSVSIGGGPDAPGFSIRSRDEVVRIGGAVHIAADEHVEGSVVAVGGSVTIDGEVDEDAVAVMGSLHLGPTAVVHGDAVSVGGTVSRAPGAKVGGEVVSASFFGGTKHSKGGESHQEIEVAHSFDSGSTAGDVWFDILLILLLALMSAAAHLVAQSAVKRVEDAAVATPWKAAVVGLLVEIFFIPVFVVCILVLAISLIGIPLLLAFIPGALIGIAAALWLGWAGVSLYAGRLVRRRFGWRFGGDRFGLFLFGSALLLLAGTMADVVGLLGSWLSYLAAFLAFAGFLIIYAAGTCGLGAVVLTRFGTRDAGDGFFGNGGGSGGAGGSFVGGSDGGAQFASEDSADLEPRTSSITAEGDLRRDSPEVALTPEGDLRTPADAPPTPSLPAAPAKPTPDAPAPDRPAPEPPADEPPADAPPKS